jgi:hypothetical protein
MSYQEYSLNNSLHCISAHINTVMGICNPPYGISDCGLRILEARSQEPGVRIQEKSNENIVSLGYW